MLNGDVRPRLYIEVPLQERLFLQSRQWEMPMSYRLDRRYLREALSARQMGQRVPEIVQVRQRRRLRCLIRQMPLSRRIFRQIV